MGSRTKAVRVAAIGRSDRPKEQVQKYAQFMKSRSDMTPEQRRAAIQHYAQRIQP